MRKKQTIEGMEIDNMIARHLDINEEWILSVDINSDGITVQYDDPNDDEE